MFTNWPVSRDRVIVVPGQRADRPGGELRHHRQHADRQPENDQHAAGQEHAQRRPLPAGRTLARLLVRGMRFGWRQGFAETAGCQQRLLPHLGSA
jgi:hypothetical protein